MLSGLSAGFQTSTTETITFLVVLGIMVIGLVIYGLVQRRRAKNRKPSGKRPVLRTSARRKLERLSLSAGEQRTLDRLVWFLRDPSQPEKLLDDEALMLRVARQAIREGIVQEPDAIRLLGRLEIDTQQLRHGQSSSSSVPNGAEVSMSDRELNVAVGEVELSNDRGLRVKCDKGHRKMEAGSPVEVVCNSGDGMFRFHSVIAARDGKEIVLRHSNHIEHIQRRKYRRREARTPVSITLPGVEQPPLRSETEDLSIGGAAIKNPKKRLLVGSVIQLTIDPEGSSPLQIQGTVLRTTKRNKIAHIAFGDVDEKTRHRLFRRIMRMARG